MVALASIVSPERGKKKEFSGFAREMGTQKKGPHLVVEAGYQCRARSGHSWLCLVCIHSPLWKWGCARTRANICVSRLLSLAREP